MSRIRSHRYITKIYNSSDCTKYTSLQSKNLYNITKRKIYLNPDSKYKLCTNHIYSHIKQRIYN